MWFCKIVQWLTCLSWADKGKALKLGFHKEDTPPWEANLAWATDLLVCSSLQGQLVQPRQKMTLGRAMWSLKYRWVPLVSSGPNRRLGKGMMPVYLQERSICASHVPIQNLGASSEYGNSLAGQVGRKGSWKLVYWKLTRMLLLGEIGDTAFIISFLEKCPTLLCLENTSSRNEAQMHMCIW